MHPFHRSLLLSFFWWFLLLHLADFFPKQFVCVCVFLRFSYFFPIHFTAILFRLSMLRRRDNNPMWIQLSCDLCNKYIFMRFVVAYICCFDSEWAPKLFHFAYTQFDVLFRVVHCKCTTIYRERSNFSDDQCSNKYTYTCKTIDRLHIFFSVRKCVLLFCSQYIYTFHLTVIYTQTLS